MTSLQYEISICKILYNKGTNTNIVGILLSVTHFTNRDEFEKVLRTVLKSVSNASFLIEAQFVVKNSSNFIQIKEKLYIRKKN